jgi:hypothetical protein
MPGFQKELGRRGEFCGDGWMGFFYCPPDGIEGGV